MDMKRSAKIHAFHHVYGPDSGYVLMLDHDTVKGQVERLKVGDRVLLSKDQAAYAIGVDEGTRAILVTVGSAPVLDVPFRVVHPEVLKDFVSTCRGADLPLLEFSFLSGSLVKAATYIAYARSGLELEYPYKEASGAIDRQQGTPADTASGFRRKITLDDGDDHD